MDGHSNDAGPDLKLSSQILEDINMNSNSKMEHIFVLYLNTHIKYSMECHTTYVVSLQVMAFQSGSSFPLILVNSTGETGNLNKLDRQVP